MGRTTKKTVKNFNILVALALAIDSISNGDWKDLAKSDWDRFNDIDNVFDDARWNRFIDSMPDAGSYPRAFNEYMDKEIYNELDDDTTLLSGFIKLMNALPRSYVEQMTSMNKLDFVYWLVKDTKPDVTYEECRPLLEIISVAYEKTL